VGAPAARGRNIVTRRLVFVTQDVDPAHPALAATVAKIRALAALVDELVVLADVVVPTALPANARARSFAAPTQLGRGLRFEAALARELRPRPLGIVAHMCPIYAVLAGPPARLAGVPVVLWFSHRRRSRRLAAAVRLSAGVVSVDRQTFPFATPKLVAIGHGIDLGEFPCGPRPDRPGLRALSLGRTSPSKGIDRQIRAVALARERGADVELDVYGPSLTDEERRCRADLERLVAGLELGAAVRLHPPVERSAVPELLARHDCLVNDTVAGAVDKAVLEAGAACVPAIASNPGFESMLGDLGLHFPPGDVEALAGRLAALAAWPVEERTRVGGVLHERVAAAHSVDAWARRLLEVVER
jgi:glycosyltransferase involved in cell wall biosynthesis